ncbi:hypothetical protein HFP15_37535 [Amycolatopsis sp. K13G38]|uniref:MFS transporter n=1 Tax=Amycolatopsis acididurans TaxID=2724524 RepID=A0ABX1JFP6_9PSEU|nr:hypothetical protein [Amycolatopsis acididurans]NKQ58563.1 hypothetical protein [Amycolatopsis acididurans]
MESLQVDLSLLTGAAMSELGIAVAPVASVLFGFSSLPLGQAPTLSRVAA